MLDMFRQAEELTEKENKKWKMNWTS